MPFSPRDGAARSTHRAPDDVSSLSLADRACIGTAIDLDATVVTADRAWQTLDVPITVEQLR